MIRVRIYGLALAAAVTAGMTALAAPASAAGAPALVPAGCAQAAAGHAHCNAIQLVTPAAANPAAPSGYGPADIQSAYQLGSNPGSGQTVAVVDAYDDPNAESDLGTYRSQYGLSACTTANGCFRKVDQTGGTNYPTGDSGWGTEITLDLDAVSATCPGCRILLVEATSNNDGDLAAAVDEAVSLGAKFVSNSYSDAESNYTSGLNSHYSHAGVVIAAATGDNGSLSGSSAQYPATFPTVVAVGGTSLSKSSNSRGWTESAWSKGGSGCSSLFAKPSFQNVSTSCNNRATSDVSAVGDPNTGLAIYDTYGMSGWAQYGGTSLATPIVTTIWALAGPAASGDNPTAYPYANAASFNDVTSGSNGSCGTVICNAGKGWDGPTGLGTPNGTAGFVKGGGNPPPTNDFSVSLSPASGSVNPGQSATGTVGTSVTSGSAVSVQLSAGGLPSGATASFNPASVTAGGSSTLTLSTSASTAPGTYSVTVTGTAGSTTHSATYTLTVNGTGGGGGTVTVANPGYQFGYINLFGANVQMGATDSLSLPLTFSATGLPPGVSITRGGYISGVPTSGGGYYTVTVTATDSGGGKGSTSFTYQVYGF